MQYQLSVWSRDLCTSNGRWVPKAEVLVKSSPTRAASLSEVNVPIHELDEYDLDEHHLA